MGEQQCPKCEGCGQIANDDSQTPWSVWLDLPLKSSAAVLMGLVKPITCPACEGSGKRDPEILTKTKLGGVAGQVVADIRDHYQNASTHAEAEAHGNQMAGVIVLHDHLSREARRILREGFEPKDRLYGLDVEVRDAFELLGLDLEEPEGDG